MMNILCKQMGIGAGIAVFAMTGCASAENTTLYSTSFEPFPTGAVQELKDGDAVWKGTGEVRITDGHQHTGSQSLHLSGGTDNTVELALGGVLQKSRGIRFQAERWTRAAPFEFRIQAQINGEWEETANLDELVRTGTFSTAVVAKFPKGKITALRLVCTAPEGKGVLIDDVALLKDEPTNITKAPTVATEPIGQLIHNETLFKSGATYSETLTMRNADKSFKNYAGNTVTPNTAKKNKERTKIYRIPAIITAKNGDLIATCDARRDHGADLNAAEDVDIAVRRSSDNGKTWSDMEIMCELGEGHPASDPSLVLDQTTGEIFCFYNYMDRSMSRKTGKNEYRLWVQSSKDHGKTWGAPRDITDEITLPEWKWDFKFMTSGRGIQRRNGELVHNLVRVGKGLHLFGSKDHGKSWYLINEEPLRPADESKVVELADESLMVNSRVNGYGARHIHLSNDGKNWTDYRDDQLVDPGCNGAILRYTDVADGYQKNRLIFSNANSFSGRNNLAVRISYDEGKTWSEGKVVDPGPSAYSDLTICPDGSIGILYEPGHGEVRFTSIALEDLTDGKDKLSKPYRLPGVRK